MAPHKKSFAGNESVVKRGIKKHQNSTMFVYSRFLLCFYSFVGTKIVFKAFIFCKQGIGKPASGKERGRGKRWWTETFFSALYIKLIKSYFLWSPVHRLVNISPSYLSHHANILKPIVLLNLLSLLFNAFWFFRTRISSGTCFQHILKYADHHKNFSFLLISFIPI